MTILPSQRRADSHLQTVDVLELEAGLVSGLNWGRHDVLRLA